MGKYYVRVSTNHVNRFIEHLRNNGIIGIHLSTDFVKLGATNLYAIDMTTEQVLSLKLSVPLLGCMHFKKTMDKLSTVNQKEKT
jgi:hypothetical protein